MFYPLFSIIFAVGLVVASRNGPRKALWMVYFPVLLFAPVWMISGFGSVLLDLRTAAGLAAVIGFLLFPGRDAVCRWSIADLLVIGVLIVQLISQYQCGNLRLLTAMELGRKWILPYVIGRLFVGNLSELSSLLTYVTRILCALSGFAVFECVTKLNLINRLLGKTYGLLEQGEGYRWGLKRAHVTFDHPIFFGMALVLLLPWAMEVARRARIGQGQSWWKWFPLILAAALFATVSRGPQMASIATVAIYFFFRMKSIRVYVIIGALLIGSIGYVQKDAIVDLLAQVAGEKDVEDIRIISIDGEDVEYTGTNHRLLLFRVYSIPIEQAGLFGFGYELKGVVIDESLAQRFGSIDCHYLLFLLQHGYLGCGAFLILTFGTLLNLTRIAWKTDLPQSGLAAGFCGALLSVAVLLVSVWFSPDFAGVWLFTAGLATSLPSLISSNTAIDPGPIRMTESAPVFVRSTAHAPFRNHDVKPSQNVVFPHAPGR